MAHARLATGRTRTLDPNIFSARTHRMANWAIPVTLGLIYGYWVAANSRDGGEITGWNLLLGFASALVFVGLWMAVRTIAPRMTRELHALAWAAFAGCAFGFLYSQGAVTALRATGMGLVIAAAVFAIMFYRYYTRED
jgi:hypothetical protein